MHLSNESISTLKFIGFITCKLYPERKCLHYLSYEH